MLSITERNIVERALAMRIAYSDSPRLTLVNIVNHEVFALTLSTEPKNALALARVGIDMCIASRWTYVPPWLLQVLNQVTQTPEVAAILAKIANPQPQWAVSVPASPFDALWLTRPGLPFLGRLSFRQSLRRLSAPSGPAVLVVNGPPQSGKSYCVELLHHVVSENTPPGHQEAPAPAALAILRRGMGASLKPEALARMIVERINPEAKPIGADAAAEMEMMTLDRRNERLCKWIFSTADATRGQWWVVLDNLDDPDLPSDTRNFVSKLAELLTSGEFRKKLRLMITDYPPELVAGVSADQIESERLGPIGEVDLRAFFEQQFQEPGGLPPEPVAVNVAVRLAMMNLPQDETRLAALNQTIREFIEKLSRKDGDA